MHGDSMFWLALAAKMAATAAFVALASRIAERAGPLLGAMVATLPISAGPAYIFLSLAHGRHFIAASAVGSLAANAGNILFCLVHALMAQRRRVATSLAAALGTWFALATASRIIHWSLASALLLNLLVLAIAVPLGSKLRHAPMPAMRRRWYDLPLRALMVATLVGIVVTLSAQLGPAATGLLALFPVVLTSLVLIVQPRAGGRATAALTANAIAGLGSYAAALTVLHLAAPPWGSPAALSLALATSVSGNATILLYRYRRHIAGRVDSA
jgi:hypothetical protein